MAVAVVALVAVALDDVVVGLLEAFAELAVVETLDPDDAEAEPEAGATYMFFSDSLLGQ